MTAQTPALDFCRRVATWQEAEGASSGLPMLIPDSERTTLDSILAQAAMGTASSQLERQARFWLVGYRELEDQQRVLTPAQREELNAVVNGIAIDERRDREHARVRRNERLHTRIVITLVIAVIALILGVITRAVIDGMHAASPVPPGNAAPVNPAQQVPAGTTPLTQFTADWGPFTELPASVQNPQTGARPEMTRGGITMYGSSAQSITPVDKITRQSGLVQRLLAAGPDAAFPVQR